ncbi:hypothetical protein ACFS07_34170 [Undibacterium arcticum]
MQRIFLKKLVLLVGPSLLLYEQLKKLKGDVMNMSHRRIVNGLTCISAFILCVQDASANGERLAAFYKNQVDPHFALVHAGVDAAAKQLGATVTHYAPTRPNNLGEQLSQLEDVIVKKSPTR